MNRAIFVEKITLHIKKMAKLKQVRIRKVAEVENWIWHLCTVTNNKNKKPTTPDHVR